MANVLGIFLEEKWCYLAGEKDFPEVTSEASYNQFSSFYTYLELNFLLTVSFSCRKRTKIDWGIGWIMLGGAMGLSSTHGGNNKPYHRPSSPGDVVENWRDNFLNQSSGSGSKQVNWYTGILQSVQSFCQEGHMWWDEHLGGGAAPQMFIAVIWPRAVFHSFYESSHAGRSKFDQGPHLACGPNFGHACPM